jgi:hypothetical protein
LFSSGVPIDPDLPDLPDGASLTAGVAADAVGAQLTEKRGHGHPTHTHCENCGTELKGPYCHRCGQHDFDINRSFTHTFLEALENFFHFDTKLFRNLIALLFQPGRMTAEFNGGKRASQVPPFRLYVFISILFFFLAFLGKEKSSPIFTTSKSDGPRAGFTVDGKPVTWDQLFDETKDDPEATRTLEKLRGVASTLNPETAGEAPPTAETSGTKADEPTETVPEPGKPKSGWEQKLEEKGRMLLSPEGQQHMLHGFLAAMPKLVLVCLPLFALYTRFLFRKSGQVYLQHLVLALHFHTFVFIWLMFKDGWVFLASWPSETLGGWVALACNLWLLVYPFLMLRRLFVNSWSKTIFKSLMLGVAYLATLGCGFVITAVIVLLAL